MSAISCVCCQQWRFLFEWHPATPGPSFPVRRSLPIPIKQKKKQNKKRSSDLFSVLTAKTWPWQRAASRGTLLCHRFSRYWEESLSWDCVNHREVSTELDPLQSRIAWKTLRHSGRDQYFWRKETPLRRALPHSLSLWNRRSLCHNYSYESCQRSMGFSGHEFSSGGLHQNQQALIIHNVNLWDWKKIYSTIQT